MTAATPKTKAAKSLTHAEAGNALRQLGYWNGVDETYKTAIRLFQKLLHLQIDGIVGPQTSAAINKLQSRFAGIVPQVHPWRLTYYYIADERLWQGTKTIPVYDNNRNVIVKVAPGAFASASLQGSMKLTDGKLINVTGKTVAVEPETYNAVRPFIPKGKPSAYAGIFIDNNKNVTRALAFHVIDGGPAGYGIQTRTSPIDGKTHAIPLTPYKTLAADLGLSTRHDITWKGKGGVVPVSSKVFILEMVGIKCPDGTGGIFTHDGWFTVCDTGGGIYGAHFDVFVGSPQLSPQFNRKIVIPDFAHIYYDRMATRAGGGYIYGLLD